MPRCDRCGDPREVLTLRAGPGPRAVVFVDCPACRRTARPSARPLALVPPPPAPREVRP